MEQNYHKQSAGALKWSSLAEVISKIITPISNIILARLLAPEEFGIVATVTMVISFVDIFCDSGFHKYLIQHDFTNENHMNSSIAVAFSSNMIISCFMWFFLFIFKNPIAKLVGNPGLGNVITIAGLALPLTALSSIQSALFSRHFEYKTLFFARVFSTLIHLVVTILFALMGFSYWALIYGTLARSVTNAIILTLLSKWKPCFTFSKKNFKEMFSFSIWSLIESLGTWLSSYIGTFIVGNMLSDYYLGLYKTTMTTVNGILAVVSSSVVPVLFTTLSRYQNDKTKYNLVFLRYINLVSILLIPLGVGIFVYDDLVTTILLGNQWEEAVPFVGVYGLMSCLCCVFGQLASEYFRGQGRPRANVLMTLLHLLGLVPVLIICSKKGFICLAYGRSLVKIEQILVYWIILWYGFNFNPLQLINKVWKSCLSAIIMGMVGMFMLNYCSSFYSQFISIIVCIVVYFVLYGYVFKGKQDIINMVKMFSGKY